LPGWLAKAKVVAAGESTVVVDTTVLFAAFVSSVERPKVALLVIVLSVVAGSTWTTRVKVDEAPAASGTASAYVTVPVWPTPGVLVVEAGGVLVVCAGGDNGVAGGASGDGVPRCAGVDEFRGGLVNETNVAPAGSGSVRVTPETASGPLLVTVRV
jgi:hypothetical protein